MCASPDTLRAFHKNKVFLREGDIPLPCTFKLAIYMSFHQPCHFGSFSNPSNLQLLPIIYGNTSYSSNQTFLCHLFSIFSEKCPLSQLGISKTILILFSGRTSKSVRLSPFLVLKQKRSIGSSMQPVCHLRYENYLIYLIF